jgi:hypothetical protein
MTFATNARWSAEEKAAGAVNSHLIMLYFNLQ